MFKLHELREIIRIIDQSSIQEFKLDHEGSKITLRKQPTGGVVTTVAQPQQVAQEQAYIVPKQEQVFEQPKTQSPVIAEAANIEDKSLYQIKSPMVGTFYRSSSPDAEPYINIGNKVNEKTVVCIVEAMKLFNEIEAEVNGEIVEILVENGQLVEYGQPLFLVKVK